MLLGLANQFLHSAVCGFEGGMRFHIAGAQLDS